MNNEDNFDLLDLDDEASTDEALPETTPFATPRPKKPWLLLGVGVLVVILATYIIVRVVGSESSSSMEIDLDAPVVTTDSGDVLKVPEIAAQQPAPQPTPVNVATPQQPAAPVATEPQPAPAPQPEVATPQPAPTAGTPVRVIEDRKEVTFNPNQAAPAAKPAAKPASKPAAKKTATTTKTSQTTTAKSSWYVQFGSYGTRAAAESAQKKLVSEHGNLFAGKQFITLAAVLPNGTTTYRLRIGFATSADANGFCRNAKSDGVDCYVAK